MTQPQPKSVQINLENKQLQKNKSSWVDRDLETRAHNLLEILFFCIPEDLNTSISHQFF